MKTRRIIVNVSTLLLIVGCALAQSRVLALPGQAGADVAAEIRRLSAELNKATQQNDATAYQNLVVAKQYAFITPGRIESLEDRLARLKASPTNPGFSQNISVTDVRIFGETAIETGRISKALYTRVWVRQSGAWKVAQYQVSPECP